jgi:hypothetical protein
MEDITEDKEETFFQGYFSISKFLLSRGGFYIVFYLRRVEMKIYNKRDEQMASLIALKQSCAHAHGCVCLHTYAQAHAN